MNEKELEQLKRMVDIYIYEHLTTKPKTANPKEIELANTVRSKLNLLDLQNVSNNEVAVCLKAKHQYRAKYSDFKYCPDCGCKLQTDC